MKVKCANCTSYKFISGLTSEPLGECKNDDALPIGVYLGTNWRLGERNSNTARYCKCFSRNKTGTGEP